MIPDYSAPTRAIARDPARTRTRKTTRTRPRLGLGHELPRVRAPLMPLKHVREVRHRLLRGVVEAKPRVRVRGHHAESVAVHRVLASTMLLDARPVCSLARGADLREGSSKSRERTPRAFPRRDALCDLCCASRRRADGVLRARVDAEKVRCCVFDGKRAGEPIGETVHLDRGCKMFRLSAHTWESSIAFLISPDVLSPSPSGEGTLVPHSLAARWRRRARRRRARASRRVASSSVARSSRDGARHRARARRREAGVSAPRRRGGHHRRPTATRPRGAPRDRCRERSDA